MKRIRHMGSARDKLLHIETEGCIVNIQVGLSDRDGNPVTIVSIIPDEYIGESWTLKGQGHNRLIKDD